MNSKRLLARLDLNQTAALMLGVGVALFLCTNFATSAYAGGTSKSSAEQANIEKEYKEVAWKFHKSRAKKTSATDWRKLAAEFSAIHKKAKRTHRRSADSLYSQGLSWREAYLADKGQNITDLEQAVAAFKGFTKIFPTHRLTDDSFQQLSALNRVYLNFGAVSQEKSTPQAALVKYQNTSRPTSTKTKPQPKTVAASNPDAPPIIKEIIYSEVNQSVRIIIALSKSVKYRYNNIPGSKDSNPRIYIDLIGSRIAKSVDNETLIQNELLSKIRLSEHGHERTRVVFDLTKPASFTIRQLDLPRASNLIIDITEDYSYKLASNTNQDVTSIKDALGLKVQHIVIDPGHGGKDPGATAFNLKEKDLVLRLAKILKKKLLEHHSDLKVTLTRSTDIFIPLTKRTEIASNMQADLFISLHFNAHKIQRFWGVETYFLNLSSDKQSLEVAARENASSTKSISSLEVILSDLLRDTNVIESSRLAYSLQTRLVSNLKKNYNVRDLGVKQAPFMVLMGAEMPSILIEGGFVTNPMESKRIASDKYLNHLADGIRQGLNSYINSEKIAQQDILSSPSG